MKHLELHLHTHYSLMDGVGTPKEYLDRAAELGMTHLAITDHGSLSGHREFQREAKEVGIMPVLGLEAYITKDRFDRTSAAKREEGDSVYNHLTMISLNENGLSNLNNASAEAWRSGFFHKPRMDFELLEQYSDDIVVLSGCMSGMIPRALQAGDQDKARELATWFKRVYGDRFFIEIMGANPKELNHGLMQLAEDMGIRPVVTSDCHHVRKEDLWLQEAMLIVSTKPKLSPDFEFTKSQKMDYLERYNYLYPERTMTFQKFDLHLKSYSEHMAALSKQGIGTEPIENTNVIADMVGEYPYNEALDLLPNITDQDPNVALRELVERGMQERGHEGDKERQERIDYELGVIKDKGFARYFLILEDIVSFAKSKKIFVGPGRGSAVSSLVVYYLGVGGIDPMEYNLLFARFLDPSRPDNPDVDLDFEMNRRHEVKDYAVRKFGHVANIITFGYIKDNSAVRDAASVLKIPLTEVNKALKMVDTWDGFMSSPTTEEFRRKYPEVVKLADAMRGRIRQSGMHAGGLVLSAEPVENYAPIQTAEDKQDPAATRVPIIAYDMRDAEQIGLIKYDILGLKTLTIIQDTINDIKDRHGYNIDLYDIDLEDAKVYEMLSSGAVRGVFQVEGAAYTKLIVKMGGVANFNELVASNALVRPGAANSSFGEQFIQGKNGGDVFYIHKDAKWFTEDTYGAVLYQEQLMHLCTDIAGMTVVESNKVRRAVGKKKADELALWKERFIEGAAEKIGDSKAEALWKDLEASADYQFNKAHAVGYSLLGYWTAWLKCYYPVEFMKNTIQHADEDMRVEHLMEAKRLGIKIMIPHVNKSDIYNTLEGDGIRLGLETIKGIKEKSASNIIRHRPYASYKELIQAKNTKGSGINATAISNLNKIGGARFEDNPLKGNERDHFYEVLKIPSFEVKSLPTDVRLQFTPVEELSGEGAHIVLAMVKDITIKGWCRVDFVDETGSSGAFTNPSIGIEKGNMYVMLIANNRIVEHTTPNELVERQDSAFAKFIMTPSLNMKDDEYRCISYRERKTKAGQLQADIVLANADKELFPAMVFESTLDRYRMALVSGTKIKPIWGETRNGGRYLKGLENGR